MGAIVVRLSQSQVIQNDCFQHKGNLWCHCSVCCCCCCWFCAYMCVSYCLCCEYNGWSIFANLDWCNGWSFSVGISVRVDERIESMYVCCFADCVGGWLSVVYQYCGYCSICCLYVSVTLVLIAVYVKVWSVCWVVVVWRLSVCFELFVWLLFCYCVCTRHEARIAPMV